MPTTDAIKERRLRPIYEFLDSNNNKKVVQEVDRLLKKFPNFSCAKVLKALALLRMGKQSECVSLITPILEEIPTDENTIQALSICYRELNQPSKVCELLENACKADKSEDLLTHCFMSYVRIGDFQKQHQIALSLYKLYPKTPYFSWAIMSLFIKACVDKDDPTAQIVSLPLAERMIVKFIEDNKIDSEHEIMLYMLILQKQEKYDKIISLVKPFLIRQTFPFSSFHNMYTNSLIKTENYDELINYLEEQISKDPKEYQFYQMYVDLFAKDQINRVRPFFENIQERYKTTKSPKALILAKFLLSKFMNIDKFSLFNEIITEYGNKSSLFFDIKPFIDKMECQEEKMHAQNVMELHLQDLKTLSPSKNKVNEVQKHLNYIYIQQYLLNEDELKYPSKVMNLMNNYVNVYLDSRDVLKNEEIKPNDKDPRLQDEFLLMASLILIKSYWNNKCNWQNFKVTIDKGVTSTPTNLIESGNENKQDNFPIYNRATGNFRSQEEDNCDSKESKKEKEQHDVKNRPAEENIEQDTIDDLLISNGLSNLKVDQFLLTDEEFPIILSMAILEYSLESSPSNSQMRLFLSKLYFQMGATIAGMTTLGVLDLKHIQWESLGYIFIWQLYKTGAFDEGERAFLQAENFYSSYHKEGMEHILSAYKYGSWSKILEFMNFRDVLLNSLQWALIRIEKQMLLYTKKATTKSQYIQIAQSSDFDPSVELSNERRLTDSRDMDIIHAYSPGGNSLGNSRWDNFIWTVEYFKLRGNILGLLNSLINLMDYIKDDEKFNSTITKYESNLNEYNKFVQHDDRTYNNTMPFDGPWPVKSNYYKNSLHIQILTSLFNMILTLVKEPQNESLNTVCKEISTLMQNTIQGNIKFWNEIKIKLYRRSELLESIHECIETLGFCTILLEICSEISKKHFLNTGKRKKRSKPILDSIFCKEFNCLLESFQDSMKKTQSEITSIGNFLGERYNRNWAQMEAYWRENVSSDLYRLILPCSSVTVMTNLSQNYTKLFSDLSLTLNTKILYLSKINIIQQPIN